MWKKLPPFIRNFYLLFGFSVLIWMLFFDPNDFVSQYQMSNQLHNLEEEYDYYRTGTQELNEISEQRQDPDELEKLAREKYLMKKKGEDVYVVVKEDKKE